MKGVSLVFEQVLLFMIGVIIFIVSFAIFNSYGLYFSESISGNQLQEVSELIVSHLIMFSKSGEYNSTVKVTVPDMIGNEPYEIRLNRYGLNITTKTSRRSVFSPLSSLNQSFQLSGGHSTSHGGEFLIYKKGDQIIIG